MARSESETPPPPVVRQGRLQTWRRQRSAAQARRGQGCRAGRARYRLGLDSYSDFMLRSWMGATDPSAELRLEIARTELMDAEAALSPRPRRGRVGSRPPCPPSGPCRHACPNRTRHLPRHLHLRGP